MSVPESAACGGGADGHTGAGGGEGSAAAGEAGEEDEEKGEDVWDEARAEAEMLRAHGPIGARVLAGDLGAR